MKGDAQGLLAVAASIADGQNVDWQTAEAGLRTDEERELLRCLRVIASIGEVHRSTDDDDPPGATDPDHRSPALGLLARRGRIVGRIGPSGGELRPVPPPLDHADDDRDHDAGGPFVDAVPVGETLPDPSSNASTRESASGSASARSAQANVDNPDQHEPRPEARRESRPEPRVAAAAAAGAAPQPTSASDSEGPPPERWGSLILRERVGAGVFGEVFRAYDEQLQREVALKLLRIGSRSHDRLAAKVLHEGRLLARVRHPNVVLVHGVEARGDRVGLWMEFIRGCTLEQLLERQGLFGAREAALIGQDLCRALAAVHGAGLVHRDLKGQNVMREEGGRVVLMDFGTGVPVRDDESGPSAVPAGTPLYLAPELLDGGEATPASDLYSLGVLLYHLVTGSYPVTAPSLFDLRAAHRRGQKRLHDARPDLPDAFVQAIDRALSPDPAQRHASAGIMQEALTRALGVESPLTATTSGATLVAPADMSAGTVVKGSGAVNTLLGATTPAASMDPLIATVPDAVTLRSRRRGLKWLLGLGIVGVVVAIALVATQPLWRTPTAGPITSVVVLPLANVSSADQDLADGINLLITERLSMVPGIRVVQYTPLMASRDRGVSQAEIIRRQQVDGLIDGTVTWTGSRAQVFVRLIQAGTNSPRWVQQFDVPTRRAAELPRDVAREVARAMAGAGPFADRLPSLDLEASEPAAFEAYLRGRVRLREGSVASVALAVEYLQDAIRRDPHHAPSFAALANCYLMQFFSLRVRTVAEGGALAKAAAERAVALDDQLPEAHQAVADVRFSFDWDWAGAEESFKRAIDLNPNAGEVRQRYAMFLVSRKRLPDAMQELHQAVALDPMSPVTNAALGMLWHYSRSDDQAERIYRSVLEQNPQSREARVGLVRTLIATRRFTQALEEIERQKPPDNQPQAPVYLGAAGMAYAGLGRRYDAETLAAQLMQDDSDGASLDAASIYAALGAHSEALSILEKAVALRLPRVLFLRMDPRFDPLRGHPRFTALLERIGLPA